MSSTDLAHTPVISPPAGIVPNFVNPETRAPVIVAFVTICLALTWTIFLVRMYSRAFVARKFTYDDVTCSIAIIGLSVFAGFVYYEMTILGPHGWDLPVTKITPMFSEVSVVATLIGSNFYAFFTKLSLFLLYLQIFAPKASFRYAVYIGIAACTLVYGGCAITAGVLCVARPGESWLEVQTGPRCLKGIGPVTVLTGMFSVLSDLYLFILPIPVVWKLHLTKRKRLGIIGIFGTGLFAIVASVCGLYYRIAAAFTIDPVWDVSAALLLAIVELSVGILCASMPYLAPLFRSKAGEGKQSPFASMRSLFARFTLRSSRNSSRNHKDDHYPVLGQYKETDRSEDSKSQDSYELGSVSSLPRGPQVTRV